MFRFALILTALALAGCGPSESPEPTGPDVPAPEIVDAAPEPETEPAVEPEPSQDRLGGILDAQPEELKARYDDRHPRETIEFFGIEPGMTVVEALPGGGWYTRILLPYLGQDGHLIGTNYDLEMWPLFSFASEDFMAQMRQWPEQFPAQAAEWCDGDCADVSTFWLGSMPEDMAGEADVVMFVRALHNLARFRDQGDYLDAALADAFAALKPGGTFGVVQHWARDDMPDDWANGANGYLKCDFVIAQAEAAGFELVARSNINANINDQPTTEEYVWRLPPSLRLPEDDPALRAQYEAIGESHRMTLKFRKPETEPDSAES